MVVLMTHDVAHTTVLHEHSDALEDFPNITIELFPVIRSLFKATEQVKLSSFLRVIMFPYLQCLLYLWTIAPVVECKDKVTMILGT